MAADTLPPGERPANTAARPDPAHITTTVPRAAGYAPLNAASADLADQLPANLAARLQQISRRAMTLEHALGQTLGVLNAIHHGGLLDTAPSGHEDRKRFDTATVLLQLLRDRLEHEDAGTGEGSDDRPYLGELVEEIDALVREARHAAR